MTRPLRLSMTVYRAGGVIGWQYTPHTLERAHQLVDAFDGDPQIARVDVALRRRDGTTGPVWRAWERNGAGELTCLR